MQKNLAGQLALLLGKTPADGETHIDIQRITTNTHTGK